MAIAWSAAPAAKQAMQATLGHNFVSPSDVFIIAPPLVKQIAAKIVKIKNI
jgi:hypothetical protein